jgi:hypothetical protein
MPPRSGNPNLHARGGLFTYVLHLPHKDSPLHTADAVVEAMDRRARFKVPVMHRLKLPQSKAGDVLDLLSHQPVTGASLFPGVGGVVRYARDRMHLPAGVRERTLLPQMRTDGPGFVVGAGTSADTK